MDKEDSSLILEYGLETLKTAYLMDWMFLLHQTEQRRTLFG